MKRPTSKTFYSANKIFLSHIQRHVEETTFIGYKTCANRINSFLGDKRLVDMTTHDLFVFVNETLCQFTFPNGKIGYAKGSRENTASYLNLLFSHFFDKGELKTNICASKIKVVGKDDRKSVRTYSDITINALKKSGSYLSLVALFGMSIGSRPSELVALTYSSIWIDMRGNTVLAINKAAPLGELKDTKNKSSMRIIVLSDDSIELLRKLLVKVGVTLEIVVKSRSKDHFLLINPKTCARFGGSKKLYECLRREFEQLELDFHGVQACRHTFATRCANIGMPFEELAGYLGHSSTQMVKSLYIDKNSYAHGRNYQQFLCAAIN